jgi:DNA-binding transcriptional LysR family regulator
MAGTIDWESQIGRRLRLRDLHVFVTVVQRGSMAKAAQHLKVTQPAISRVIGDLEHTLGVRLLDRSAKGVQPSLYGRALLSRSTVVFDELKQSIRDIQFLADPTIGELRIGCVESITATILSPIIDRFNRQYPRVVLHVDDLTAPAIKLEALRDRKYDFILARLPLAEEHLANELNIEFIIDDQLVIATSAQNRWARRRRIELAELINEPWILTAPHTWNYLRLEEAFRARDLDMPKVSLVTFSVHLRADLLATGRFITAVPRSIAVRYLLKVLPVDLPAPPWPVVIATLKNRRLSPVVERFIEHVRAFARSMGTKRPTGGDKSS